MNYLPRIPAPSERRIAFRVKPAAERALRNGHPWLFDHAIRRQSYEGKPGALGVVFDNRRRFLAVGLYDPHSPIRLRVLQHGSPATIDLAWFQKRLSKSIQRRALLLNSETSGYRLVNGGNDGMPGLVVDRYADSYVLKLYTVAWIPHLASVLTALSKLVTARRFVLRLSRSIQRDEHHLYGLFDGQVLLGEPLEAPVVFKENGLRFEANLAEGQKTGFFLDQRDNRARVESIVASDAALRRVINVFAYTGAFSLYAARGGAEYVVSLEASRPALEAAGRNFQLNVSNSAIAATRHDMMQGDAFHLLRQLGQRANQFDLVIIDPPSFAKNRSEKERALAAYRQLVRSGLALVRSGGVLAIASCSSQIGDTEFFDSVYQTAQNSGRPLSEIERTGHALDHPVSFPQGAYLKCLFAVAS